MGLVRWVCAEPTTRGGPPSSGHSRTWAWCGGCVRNRPLEVAPRRVVTPVHGPGAVGVRNRPLEVAPRRVVTPVHGPGAVGVRNRPLEVATRRVVTPVRRPGAVGVCGTD